MKKFQYIVVLLFVIVLGTGCSNDEKQENFLSETENEIENKEDGVIYEVYTGNWSNDGRTHDQILSEGGVELSCTITESNRLTGTLFAQQEIERFIKYYNEKRIKEKLGWMSPVQYRLHLLAA